MEFHPLAAALLIRNLGYIFNPPTTHHDRVLKLSAQLYPLYPDETRVVRLEVKRDGGWKEIGIKEVNDIGWSATFRIPDWDEAADAS
jgi:hypothetical protein